MPAKSSNRRSRPVPEIMFDCGIWVFESRHDETFFMSPTVHQFPKLLYFREGSGEMVADWPEPLPKNATCVSGDCVVVPANLQHRIIDHPNHPISLYGLAVDPKRVSYFSEIEPMIPCGRLSQQRAQQLNIEGRLRRLLYLVAQANPAFQLSAVAAAIDTFAQLAMAEQPNRSFSSPVSKAHTEEYAGVPDAIDEYLLWLHSNFFERLSVNRAARSCRMSRRKFTADFRERTGQTWLAYVNQLRVDHAVRLLSETDSKVTSIAFQSGFEDLSTFYRTVKRLTGKRPLDFRASPSSGS